MNAKKIINLSIYKKAAIFIVLLLTISYGLSEVRSVLFDRETYQQDTEKEIKSKWGESVHLGTLHLVIPYQEVSYREVVYTQEDVGIKNSVKKEKVVRDGLIKIVPTQSTLNSNNDVVVKRRGPYEIPVFTAYVDMKGSFKNVENILNEFKEKNKNVEFLLEKTSVQMSVENINGINNVAILLDDQEKEYEIISKSNVYYVQIPWKNFSVKKDFEYSVSLESKGSSQVKFNAYSLKTAIQMSGNWGETSFQGYILPNTSKIVDEKYSATWSLSNPMQTRYYTEYSQSPDFSVGVKLMDKNSTYTQVDRSLKYGFLFVMLTFLSLFIVELLGGFRLHPVQYLLVGFAMLLFYLIILSLGEKIDFALAYLIGTFAVVASITLYIKAILKERKYYLSVTGVLISVYSYMYAAMESKDNALLIGTSCLFLVMVAIMYLTRNIDWYQLNQKSQKEIA